MKLRALTSDDKAVRRSAILSAARTLFTQNSHQLPSAAEIARASGLAKGTVYLYFRTKEEIFISLLEQEFKGLLNQISSFFEGEWQAQGINGMLTRIADYLQQHPEFLRLDAMAYSVLEQNLSTEHLLAFKIELTTSLKLTGDCLDQALQLRAGRGVELLLRTYALMRGLWQTLDYPAVLSQILADPQFAAIRPPFDRELMITLQEYWRGALFESSAT